MILWAGAWFIKTQVFISWKIRKCLISEKSGFRAFICLWTDVYDSSLVQLETSTACDTFKPTGLASWRAPMIPIKCVWLIHNITVLVLIWLYNITVEALIVAAAADSQLGCVFLSGACLLVMFPPEMISTVIVSSPARVSVCSLCLESCLDIKAVRKLLRDALDWNQLEQVDSGNCSLSVEGG